MKKLATLTVVILTAITGLGLTQDKLEPGRSLYEHPGGILHLGHFYVPADQEIIFTDSVEIRVNGEIVIDGVLRGAEATEPGHERKKIKLTSHSGIVIRGNLIPHTGYSGREVLEDGGPGGDLELRAPLIVSSKMLRAGDGGDGGPGGGNGGSGGTMLVAGQYVGPYRGTPENALSFMRGGEGGEGTKGDRSIGGAANGGTGGSGGVASGEHFKEEFWMVPLRESTLLATQEIEILRESAMKQNAAERQKVLQRFEPKPVRGVSKE